MTQRKKNPQAVSTQLQVAQRAGVSRSLVSHVLRGRTDLGISEETRQRVLRAAADLAYKPPRQYQPKRAERMLAVCLGGGILHGFANPYIAEVLLGVSEAARIADYHLLLIAPAEQMTDGQTVPRAISQRRVQGVVYLSQIPAGLLDLLQKLGEPVTVAGAWMSEPGIDCVTSDGYEQGVMAADYLVGQGHRHIAMLRGPRDMMLSQRQRDGFRDQLGRHGLEQDFVVEFPVEKGNEIDRQAGQLMTERLLERWRDSWRNVTAIFCTNDATAMGALEVLRREGVGVPEHLSVMGVDDIRGADHTMPPLTTIRVPKVEIGQLATQRLISRIENPGQVHQRIILPVSVVERQTIRRL